MLEQLTNLLGAIWPLTAAAIIALLFAATLASQQERGRQHTIAEREGLTALRDFRRVLAAAATRSALGGTQEEIYRAENAICPFLVKVLDASQQFPTWKQKLVCECLVNLAGHDTFVAQKIACSADPRQQGDFWFGVYQQFRVSDELSPEESDYLSQREARFGARPDWEGLVADLGPLETAMRLPWWRISKRRRTRPHLSSGIRQAVRSHLL